MPSRHHSVDQSRAPGDAGLGAALGGEGGSVRRSEYLWSHCVGRRPERLALGLVRWGGAHEARERRNSQSSLYNFLLTLLEAHGNIRNQHRVY